MSELPLKIVTRKLPCGSIYLCVELNGIIDPVIMPREVYDKYDLAQLEPKKNNFSDVSSITGSEETHKKENTPEDIRIPKLPLIGSDWNSEKCYLCSTPTGENDRLVYTSVEGRGMLWLCLKCYGSILEKDTRVVDIILKDRKEECEHDYGPYDSYTCKKCYCMKSKYLECDHNWTQVPCEDDKECEKCGIYRSEL